MQAEFWEHFRNGVRLGGQNILKFLRYLIAKSWANKLCKVTKEAMQCWQLLTNVSSNMSPYMP
uniref:Uncharacterized protein n=1 Tax=Amphimedon queenslandica TaxID=400682 RepID=A0A1X7UJ69_AMPQE